MKKPVRTTKQLALIVAIVLCAATCSAASSRTAEPRQPRAPTEQAVTVEVLGFAAMEPGMTLKEAHREALLDARRNAVIQAHVVVDVRTSVENMRLKQRRVRSRGIGYVERMDVRDSGIVPDTDPPIYRVCARVVVRPLAVLPTVPPAAVSALDTWKPVVVLELESDLPSERQAMVLSELADAMLECGIALAPHRDRPELHARVVVSAAPSDGVESLQVDWEIGRGGTDGAETPQAARPAGGHWLVSGTANAGPGWCQRLGVAMAQDAVRLWATPRRTTETL